MATLGTGWPIVISLLTQLTVNMKNFDFLKRDDNQVPIQTGTHIQCFDATTGTPQESPLVITDAAIVDIVIPSNAAEVIFSPSVDMRVSEDADMSSGYFVQGASVTQAYGVAGMDNIYVRGSAATGILQFYFVLVKE